MSIPIRGKIPVTEKWTLWYKESDAVVLRPKCRVLSSVAGGPPVKARYSSYMRECKWNAAIWLTGKAVPFTEARAGYLPNDAVAIVLKMLVRIGSGLHIDFTKPGPAYREMCEKGTIKNLPWYLLMHNGKFYLESSAVLKPWEGEM